MKRSDINSVFTLVLQSCALSLHRSVSDVSLLLLICASPRSFLLNRHIQSLEHHINSPRLSLSLKHSYLDRETSLILRNIAGKPSHLLTKVTSQPPPLPPFAHFLFPSACLHRLYFVWTEQAQCYCMFLLCLMSLLLSASVYSQGFAEAHVPSNTI